MTIRRRLLLVVAAFVLFATAIEYGLIIADLSTATVAEGTGPHIN
jgi:hypothetical protein